MGQMEVNAAHIQLVNTLFEHVWQVWIQYKVRREKKNIKMLNRFSVQKCFHFIFLYVYFYLTQPVENFVSIWLPRQIHVNLCVHARYPACFASLAKARRLSLPGGPTPATVKTFVRGFAVTKRAAVCERAFSSGLIVGSRHGALPVVACKPSVVRRLYLLHLNLPVLLSLCSTRLARHAATHVD